MFVIEKEKNYFKYEKKVTLSLVSRNEVVFSASVGFDPETIRF